MMVGWAWLPAPLVIGAAIAAGLAGLLSPVLALLAALRIRALGPSAGRVLRLALALALVALWASLAWLLWPVLGYA